MNLGAPEVTILAVILIGGFLAGNIATGKGKSFASYFILGALFPLIGIIVALAAQPDRGRQLTPAPVAGWHPDPTGRFDRRYYDGNTWTRHVTRDSDGRQFEDIL